MSEENYLQSWRDEIAVGRSLGILTVVLKGLVVLRSSGGGVHEDEVRAPRAPREKRKSPEILA